MGVNVKYTKLKEVKKPLTYQKLHANVLLTSPHIGSSFDINK